MDKQTLVHLHSEHSSATERNKYMKQLERIQTSCYVKESSHKRSHTIQFQLSIQKTKIMGSSPITSWQIDGETVETVTDFILGSSKITADGDCSREIKRR